VFLFPAMPVGQHLKSPANQAHEASELLGN
jgi:hypothetical protein